RMAPGGAADAGASDCAIALAATVLMPSALSPVISCRRDMPSSRYCLISSFMEVSSRSGQLGHGHRRPRFEFEHNSTPICRAHKRRPPTLPPGGAPLLVARFACRVRQLGRPQGGVPKKLRLLRCPGSPLHHDLRSPQIAEAND